MDRKKETTEKVVQTSFGMTMNTTTKDIPISYADQIWDIVKNGTSLLTLVGETGQFSQNDINELFSGILVDYNSSIGGLQGYIPTIGSHTESIAQINNILGEWSESETVSDVIGSHASSISSLNNSLNSVLSVIGDDETPSEGSIRYDISRILSAIPSGTFDSGNSLADKNFVNSTINSLSATFRGTFATLALLKAQTGVFYNNDYAYVESDEEHNNESWRYHYSSTSGQWYAVFKVNDTPFTSVQLNSINSGITAELVEIFKNKQNALPTPVIGCVLRYMQPGGYEWYNIAYDFTQVRGLISDVEHGIKLSYSELLVSDLSLNTNIDVPLYIRDTNNNIYYSNILGISYTDMYVSASQSGTKKNFSKLQIGNNVIDSSTGYALGAIELFNGKATGNVHHSTTLIASNDVSSNIVIRAKQSGLLVTKPDSSQAVGSSTHPVFIDANGQATSCSFELQKSVTSSSKLTDTTYSGTETVTVNAPSSGTDTGSVEITSSNASAIINKLTQSTTTPSDNDYYVAQYANGGTTTKTYHRRPLSALWEYIKNKCMSFFSLKEEGVRFFEATYNTTTYPTFSTSKAYSVGDVVIYSNICYRFTSAHTAGSAWASGEVEMYDVVYNVTDTRLTEYYNGYMIQIRVPLTGGSSVSLKVNNLAAVPIYLNLNTTPMTRQWNAGSIIGLVYYDNKFYHDTNAFFANNIWYPVGDDVYIGDRNIGGALCLMGASASSNQTAIALFDKANNGRYGKIIIPSSLSATRTFTLPDKTGTFAMTSDIKAERTGVVGSETSLSSYWCKIAERDFSSSTKNYVDETIVFLLSDTFISESASLFKLRIRVENTDSLGRCTFKKLCGNFESSRIKIYRNEYRKVEIWVDCGARYNYVVLSVLAEGNRSYELETTPRFTLFSNKFTTVQTPTLTTTIQYTDVNIASRATQDGDGNVISSTYLKLIGGVLSGSVTATDFIGKINGNTWDVSTNNTADTLVICKNGSTLQHRVIPVAYNTAPSASGNRAANVVVSSSAAGQISSEKWATTSSGTVKCTTQYNETDQCLDFIFS